MTHLKIFDAGDERTALADTRDTQEIADALGEIGVRYEHWGSRGLPQDTSSDAILAAYAPEIERLTREGGYTTVDTLTVLPTAEGLEAMRTKFLSEHRHTEDEVRFMVEGDGLFTLRSDDDRVYMVEIGKGDLISVPAGMRHWFDMGPSPRITVIRMFIDPAGWVAHYTGDAIADRFPRHEPVAA